ncbi:uncharacterized protein LOC104885090 [Beta vulgaris subsp. vulgaris]|uniref:uncharacterized protein LOC104885090 n=1 Tax=Beta vulgaris subsp. vulgaris TaxID=3555 RepID=UPI00053F9A27|nr:uncharacterized protein LOC104885090 [Beta vulgaris subsp. vulgaris]
MTYSTETPSNSENVVSNYNDPYFLSNGDNTNHSIINYIFNGNNFINWNRVVRVALIARNKLGFLDGTLKKPAPNSSDYQKWNRNDHMVMSWLSNSMEKSIVENFLFADSTFQFWTEVVERYGHTNIPQLYKHRTLMKTEQGNQSVAEYYSKLKRVWDEIHVLDGFPDCSCGAIAKCSCNLLKRILEADEVMKLIQFVSGLNEDYDLTKQNLLSSDPLPTVNHAFHILQQVERQNMNAIKVDRSGDMSALLATKTSTGSVHKSFSSGSGQKRDYRDVQRMKYDRTCDHCKMKGHTMDSCFKLVGYPEWYSTLKGRNQPKLAAHVQDSGVL